jgi:hypothetical protein
MQPRHKSVTHVLNLNCYLSSDYAPFLPIPLTIIPLTLISPPVAVR